MAILVYDASRTIALRPFVVLPLLAVASVLFYVAYTAVYNIFFHPLRKFPGPKLWAANYGFYAYLEVSGEGHRRMLAIHKKYGPVVRVAPDRLAFCHPDAIHDLSGHRKPSLPENSKETLRYIAAKGSVLSSGKDDHTRMRKSMASGFSHQAMLDQQPLITVYIDKLFERFREFSTTGEAFDAIVWYNYTTFDIVGDLAFGEPFQCLDQSTYHPWVDLVCKYATNVVYDSVFRRMGSIHNLLVMLTPKSILSKIKAHDNLTEQKVRRRLNTITDRKDFMGAITARKGAEALTFHELCANASLFIVAGSETTATALSATTYYLGSNPEPLKKLCDEVRSAFKSEEEIDILSVGRLDYLLAVLNEAMRIHPAAAGAFPRTINEGGDTIAGHYVPPGTHVDIWFWAAFRHPDYWVQPEEFIPERWLGDARFEKDQKRIFAPFSVGPRNCIGKNLSLAEMRLVLARLIWNYDIELAEGSAGWDDRCKLYVVFDKGPLYIRLRPRK
ncbi:cytochrome P450 [Trichoderma chlorosporum]